MASAQLVSSSLLEEIRTFLEHPDRRIYEFESERRCLGTTSAKVQCKRSFRIESAKEAIRGLKEISDYPTCPNNPNFYDNLKIFIGGSHCSQDHKGPALDKFQKWKEKRSAAAELHSAQPLELKREEEDDKRPSDEESIFSQDDLNDSFVDTAATTPDTTQDMTEETFASAEGPKTKSAPPNSTTREIFASEKAKPPATNSVDRDNATGDKPKTLHNTVLGHIEQRIKDPSMEKLVKTVCDPFSKKAKAIGRVYILQLKNQPDDNPYIKIGFTEKSGETRLHQNCERHRADLVWQSSSFVGAYRAEKMAEKLMVQQNLLVIDCFECGDNHTEWFQAKSDTAIPVIESCEDFVINSYADGILKDEVRQSLNIQIATIFVPTLGMFAKPAARDSGVEVLATVAEGSGLMARQIPEAPTIQLQRRVTIRAQRALRNMATEIEKDREQEGRLSETAGSEATKFEAIHQDNSHDDEPELPATTKTQRLVQLTDTVADTLKKGMRRIPIGKGRKSREGSEEPETAPSQKEAMTLVQRFKRHLQRLPWPRYIGSEDDGQRARPDGASAQEREDQLATDVAMSVLNKLQQLIEAELEKQQVSKTAQLPTQSATEVAAPVAAGGGVEM